MDWTYDPRQRLADMPHIVDIVMELGRGAAAPNVGHRPRAVPGSRPAADLTYMELTRDTDHRPPEESTAPLLRLYALACELGCEPAEATSWRTVCDALWLGWPAEPTDRQEKVVESCYTALAARARISPERKYKCPRCPEGGMRLTAAGDRLICDDCGHNERTNLAQRYRRRPPMGAADLVEEFAAYGLKRDNLRTWVARRKLKRAGGSPRQPTYYPWDVICCLFPGIADQQ